jgi:hypothetical protein
VQSGRNLNNVSNGRWSVSTKLQSVTTQKAVITSNLSHSNYLHVSTSAVPKHLTSRRCLRNNRNSDFCSISVTRNSITNGTSGVTLHRFLILSDKYRLSLPAAIPQRV